MKHFLLTRTFILSGLIFFGQIDINAQWHCCYEGKCYDVPDPSKCTAGSIVLEGTCENKPCIKDKCCSILAGCIDIATKALCEAQGHGSFFIGPNGNCDPCTQIKGKCCLYRSNFSFYTSINTNINDCRTNYVPGDVSHNILWQRDASQPCPTSYTASNQVKLSSLDALYVEESGIIALNWEVNTDNKIVGFYIERSKDGNIFKRIGFLENRSNQTGMQRFEYKDVYPLNIGHYRFLRINEDGTLEYSYSTKIAAYKNEDVVIYPNPISNQFQILIKGNSTHETEVLLYDFSGRLVLSQTFNKGVVPKLNLSELLPGIFTVKIKQGTKVFVKKIIKREIGK